MEAERPTASAVRCPRPSWTSANDQIIVTTNNAQRVHHRSHRHIRCDVHRGRVVYVRRRRWAPRRPRPSHGTFDDAYWSTGTGNYYIVAANAANTNTYLYRYPYNGSLGAAAGFVQLHRSGTSSVVATSPVTEFLSTGTPNKDEVYVSGGGGTYLFMNRVLANFAGTDGSPASMANWFATPGGGAVSPIVIDTNTAAITGGTATANIYYGTKAVGPATTQSTIVQLAQQF